MVTVFRFTRLMSAHRFGSLPPEDSAAETPPDAPPANLLEDLMEASEMLMHRAIAHLQQQTITELHERLRDACSRVFLRCLQLGLSQQEAQDAANQLRMEQYKIGLASLRAQIQVVRHEHQFRVEALERWYAQHIDRET